MSLAGARTKKFRNIATGKNKALVSESGKLEN
jgi:hypothetical protein